MRIIQLIPQTAIGGAESFGFDLGCELARRGHEVLLLSNRANGPLLERPHPPGMRSAALDRRSRLDPRIVPFLIGSIHKFRPDVIHAHNFEANTWARAAALLFPKVIVCCHEHSGLKGRQKTSRDRLDRLLYRRCAAVFCVNDELRDLMRDRVGVRESILHVLPNGIDVDRYVPPVDARPTAAEVVCVASLTPVKNHEMLLRSWAIVARAHREARLTIVGEGPLRGALEEQARDLGIDGQVVFAGLQADVRPFLWRAGIFVMASHREGLPLALLEAMAAGCACVAPDVGGIAAALAGGEAGRVVPPEDPDLLATALLDLVENPETRSRLGNRARAEVVTRYSLRACVTVIESVYREAQDGPRFMP